MVFTQPGKTTHISISNARAKLDCGGTLDLPVDLSFCCVKIKETSRARLAGWAFVLFSNPSFNRIGMDPSAYVGRYRKGMIVKITMRNFLTFSAVTVAPGPRLNVVIGANGTGYVLRAA